MDKFGTNYPTEIREAYTSNQFMIDGADNNDESFCLILIQRSSSPYYLA